MSDSYDLQRYRDIIPEKQRKRMGRRVKAADVLDYPAIAGMAQELLGDLVAGNIPPEMVREARALIEVMLVSVAAFESSHGGGVGRGVASVAELIKNAGDPKKFAPSYTIAEADGTELPVIDLKAGG